MKIFFAIVIFLSSPLLAYEPQFVIGDTTIDQNFKNVAAEINNIQTQSMSSSGDITINDADLVFSTTSGNHGITFQDGTSMTSAGVGQVGISANANQFNGDGTLASELTLESSSVTLQGNAVNGNSTLVKTNGSGQVPLSITGNAATVTTNANLTGNVTSVGNATTIVSVPTGAIVSVPTGAVNLSTVTANHVLKSGDTMTGPLTNTSSITTGGFLLSASQPFLYINADAAQTPKIAFQRGGINQWYIGGGALGTSIFTVRDADDNTPLQISQTPYGSLPRVAIGRSEGFEANYALDVTGGIHATSSITANAGFYGTLIGSSTLNVLKSGDTMSGPLTINSSATLTGAVSAGSYQVAGSTVVKLMTSGTGIAIGLDAGRINTGAGNTFVGYGAGYANLGGDNNTFTGIGAGLANQTGYYNTIYGDSAGATLTTGHENILIGHNANVPASGSSHYLNIANSIYGTMTAGSTMTFVAAISAPKYYGDGSALAGLYAGVGKVDKIGDTMTGRLIAPDYTATYGIIASSASFSRDIRVSMVPSVHGLTISRGDANDIFQGILLNSPSALYAYPERSPTVNFTPYGQKTWALGSVYDTFYLTNVDDSLGVSVSPTGLVTAPAFAGNGAALTNITASPSNTVTSSFTITGNGGQFGLQVSSNVYIVGYSSATKYYGDGSSLTGVADSSTSIYTATGTWSGGQTFNQGITFNIPANSSMTWTCPSGFLSIQKMGVQLGCVQIAAEGNTSGLASMTNCFNKYGGRLPTFNELKIAWTYYSASLSNPGVRERASETCVTTDYDSMALDSNNSSLVLVTWGGNTQYRCWLPR